MGSGAVPASAGPDAASSALLASAPFVGRLPLLRDRRWRRVGRFPGSGRARLTGPSGRFDRGRRGCRCRWRRGWGRRRLGAAASLGRSGRRRRSRRRVRARDRGPGAATTSGDASHPLQPFEAGDESFGSGVGLGDRRSDQREFEGETGGGGPAHVGLRRDQERDHAPELGRRVLRGLRGQALGLLVGGVEQVVLARRGLDEQQVAEVREHLVGDVPEVLPLLHEPVDELEHALGVPDRDRVAERVLHVRTSTADQRQDDVLADLAGAEHRGLVEQRERVADRTLRLARDRVCRLRGERHALVLRDAFEVLGDRLDRDAAEVEPLAAPDDRGRHLVRLGRREDEPDTDRRLLEHLQQRVERLARQPLRLVDDVDLLAALDRRGGRLLAEIARVVDAAVGGRVDLDHVQVLPVPDGHALIARAAGFGRGAGLAVDHLGQDPGRRGLPGPARPAQQERVRQPPLADGARERSDHVVLTEHLRGALRAVLAVQRLVRLVVGHIHLRAPRARLDPRGEAREVRQSLGGGRAPVVDRGGLERITGR